MKRFDSIRQELAGDYAPDNTGRLLPRQTVEDQDDLRQAFAQARPDKRTANALVFALLALLLFILSLQF